MPKSTAKSLPEQSKPAYSTYEERVSDKAKISDYLGTRLYAPTAELEQFGTFADSKQAPIHRWFQYPAGFSYRAVEHILELHDIRAGQIVYDPFVGTGTTAVVCKKQGIEAYGIEAHQFVHCSSRGQSLC